MPCCPAGPAHTFPPGLDHQEVRLVPCCPAGLAALTCILLGPLTHFPQGSITKR